MKASSHTRVQSHVVDRTSDNLTDEIRRALEMMKRVRKCTVAQTADPFDSEDLPSYLLPDSILMCQSH